MGLNDEIKEKSNVDIWNKGLHNQVDEKEVSSTFLWDKLLSKQIKEKYNNE